MINSKIKILSDQLLDSLTKEKLTELEELYDSINSKIIALPDIHHKKADPFPTGIVFHSDKIILSLLQAPNCGMSLLKANFSDNSIESYGALFKKLEKIIPKTSTVLKLSKKDLQEIICTGADWALKNLDFEEGEINAIEKQGNFFKNLSYTPREILDSIPPIVFNSLKKDLGTIGGGNHFLELQKVIKIHNEKGARAFNLKLNDTLFMLHTDSRRFGGLFSSIYSNAFKRSFLSKLKIGLYQLYFFKKIFFNRKYLDINSKLGRKLLIANNAAMNVGYVNRLLIIHSLKKIFKGDIKLISDLSHSSQQVENNNLSYRIGATRSTPGTLLMVPGSMGTSSFICRSTGSKENLFSANHGTGRGYFKEEIPKKFSEKQLVSFMHQKKIRVFRCGNDNLLEQIPLSFKDSRLVLNEMVKYKIAEPIVETFPLAVLKG